MAITFVGYGAAAVGTTALAVPYPAVSAGNMMVLCVENKYTGAPPTTPSGWTLVKQQVGGSGAAGVDTGTAYISIYAKIADGTETGNLNVALTGANSAVGRMGAWTKEPDSSWAAGYGVGVSQDSAFTNLAIQFAGANLRQNDVIMVAGGINTKNYTYSTFDFSASGIVFSAKSGVTTATAAGDDSHLLIYRAKVFSGGPAASLTFTLTASGSATDAPAGAFALLVLREIGPSVRSAPIRRRIKNIICLPSKRSSPDLSDIFRDRFPQR